MKQTLLLICFFSNLVPWLSGNKFDLPVCFYLFAECIKGHWEGFLYFGVILIQLIALSAEKTTKLLPFSVIVLTAFYVYLLKISGFNKTLLITSGLWLLVNASSLFLFYKKNKT